MTYTPPAQLSIPSLKTLRVQNLGISQLRYKIRKSRRPENAVEKDSGESVSITAIEELAAGIAAKIPVINQQMEITPELLEKRIIMLGVVPQNPEDLSYALDFAKTLADRGIKDWYIGNDHFMCELVAHDLKHGAQRSRQQIAEKVNEWLNTPGSSTLWDCLEISPPQEESLSEIESMLCTLKSSTQEAGAIIQVDKSIAKLKDGRALVFDNPITCTNKDQYRYHIIRAPQESERRTHAHGSKAPLYLFSELGRQQCLDPSRPQHFSVEAVLSALDSSPLGEQMKMHLRGVGEEPLAFHQVVLLPPLDETAE